MSYFASSWTYSKLVKDTHWTQWSHFKLELEIEILKFLTQNCKSRNSQNSDTKLEFY